MPNKGGVALIFVSLVLGAGFGTAVGGCGEDRGSVDIEGDTGTGTVGTTGTTGTVGTTGTTTTP